MQTILRRKFLTRIKNITGILFITFSMAMATPAFAAPSDEPAELAAEYTEVSENTSETASESDTSEAPKVIRLTDSKTSETADSSNDTADEAAASDNESAEETEEAGSGISGSNVIEFAKQFLGGRYRYGGSSLTGGTDCSGFTMSVYRNFGIALPHSSASQRSVGTAVGSLEQAEAGDIVCYSGHVALYIGNGQIIHALNANKGITISNARYNRILAIRRVL